MYPHLHQQRIYLSQRHPIQWHTLYIHIHIHTYTHITADWLFCNICKLSFPHSLNKNHLFESHEQMFSFYFFLTRFFPSNVIPFWFTLAWYKNDTNCINCTLALIWITHTYKNTRKKMKRNEIQLFFSNIR